MNNRGSLEGRLYAANREELVKQAKEKTKAYFKTDCIKVNISEEKAHPYMNGFNANFIGAVWHDVEVKSYGPNVCRGCGAQEYASDKLNAKSSEWE